MQSGKGRGKVAATQIGRISDHALREAVYGKRKNALFRRATELSNMCDCEIAVIMFTPDGELSSFSTSSMEEILRRYSRHCTELHETQTREGMNKRAADRPAATGIAAPATKKRKDDGRGARVSGEHDTEDALLALQSMHSADVAVDAPAAPDQADIDREFNKLIEDRAKRAAQAAGGNTKTTQTANGIPPPSASGSDREGPDAIAPSLLAPAGLYDSLAAVLAGSAAISAPTNPTSNHDTIPLNPSTTHVKPENENNVVETPAVSPVPPVAGSAPAQPALGPTAR